MTGLDFAGRIAVIAGGCGGIGQAVRARLIAAGATAIVWDVTEGADSRIDLTSEAAVNEAMAALIDRFGRIDVLVNAAGITGPTVNIEDYSLADWRRVLDVNLTSIFLCCKYAIPLLVQRGGGRIVNIASSAGLLPVAGAPAYCASKAGVVLLTKQITLDYSQFGVIANALCPTGRSPHTRRSAPGSVARPAPARL